MKTEYKNDLGVSRLIFELDGAYEEDYRSRMILSNRVPGILPCVIGRVDERTRFCFEITGTRALKEELAERPAGMPLIQNLITSLLQAREGCAAYLIPAMNILLDPEYIFMSGDTFSFCFLPAWERDFAEAFHELTGALLERVDYEDQKAVELVYELRGKTKGNYSIQRIIQDLSDVGTLTGEEREEGDSPGLDEDIPAANEMTAETPPGKAGKIRILRYVLCAALVILIVARVSAYGFREELLPVAVGLVIFAAIAFFMIDKVRDKLAKRRDQRKENPASAAYPEEARGEEESDAEPVDEVFRDDYEDELGDEDPATTFLRRDDLQPRLTLRAENSIDSLSVTGSPFLVGSSEKQSDGLVLSPAVSRSHARIDQIAGAFFLEDLSSKNGTFYNGERLMEHERVELRHGDHIVFGDRNFTVVTRFRG